LRLARAVTSKLGSRRFHAFHLKGRTIMSTRHTAFAAFTLALAASALLAPRLVPRTGLEAASKAPAPGLVVTIDNFAFGQKEVSVARGTIVTWLNRDDMPHTVVSSDRSFQSPPLDTGDRFSHTFGKPGTYEYFCSIHPRMTGRIVVR
jgi:plastocyanin